MSGNFTQRGEIAVTDKFTRAEHAIKAGADIVFELPTVFATAPAEIFAKGAVKLAGSFSCEKTLCFGTERAEKEKLISTAKALLEESKEFKTLYKEELKKGVSPIRAKVDALSVLKPEGVDLDLLKSPNNILAVEYAKAVVSAGADIDLAPIIREGAAYDDETLKNGVSSAAAIRKAIAEGKKSKIKKCVPAFVYPDMPDALPSADDFVFYSLLRAPRTDIRKITDCGEGLENRIKALLKDCSSTAELKDKLKTKRYTATRLSRVLLSCMLGIDFPFVSECLKSRLYLKILAVKKEKTDVLSAISRLSTYPIVARKNDVRSLSGVALECFKKDAFANDVANYVFKKRTNEYDMKTVL